MTIDLIEKCASEVVGKLLGDIVSYSENLHNYLAHGLNRDKAALNVFRNVFGVSTFVCDDVGAELCAKFFLAKPEKYDVFIQKYAGEYLAFDEGTLLYWVMWFAGFDSQHIEVCEDALNAKVRSMAAPVIIAI